MLGCPCSLMRYSHFSTDRAQNQGKSTKFLACACTRGGGLNETINYAQKGCESANVRNDLKENPILDSKIQNRILRFFTKQINSR